mgnify:CR=1 FL=1
MNKPLKIPKIGNSAGIVLPKEVLARLRVGPGDRLYLSEAPDGVRLTAVDPDFSAKMDAAEAIMREGLAGPAVGVLEPILARGRETGMFRDDVDAFDVHVLISSFCVFRVANRHTVSAIFGRDLLDPARRAHYRRMVGDLVVEYLTARVGQD